MDKETNKGMDRVDDFKCLDLNYRADISYSGRERWKEAWVRGKEEINR